MFNNKNIIDEYINASKKEAITSLKKIENLVIFLDEKHKKDKFAIRPYNYGITEKDIADIDLIINNHIHYFNKFKLEVVFGEISRQEYIKVFKLKEMF